MTSSHSITSRRPPKKARACNTITATLLSLCVFRTCCATNHWQLQPGPTTKADAVLCNILFKRLREASADCESYALRTYPGFQDPPWMKIDPRTHTVLVARMAFMGLNPPQVMAEIPAEKLLAEKGGGVNNFISHGGSVSIWRTNLFTDQGVSGDNSAIPPQQDVALLSWGRMQEGPSEVCPGVDARATYQGTFLVTQGLDNLATNVPAAAATILSSSVLLLYHGETLIVGPRTVGRNFNASGHPDVVCNFESTK